MAWALFLVVAGIWAVFLIPPLWADRRPSSIHAARRHAGLEEPGQRSGTGRNVYEVPGYSAAPEGSGLDRSVILARRRRILVVLAGGASTSLVAAIVFSGSWLVALHVAADALLIGYVVMLRRIAQARRGLAPQESEFEDEMLEMSAVRVVRSS